jgi:hypothetical protein
MFVAVVGLLGLGLAHTPLRAADPAGQVHFVAVANSSFDVFTQNPTQAQKDWMGRHYWRMLAYAPYFDSRLSWFPDAWVYKDIYAIYVGSSLASQHPEWILRDANGNRLYIPYGCSGGSCPQYAADIGNPAYRTFWIGQASTTLVKGYRGLFVDDVNMLISRVSNGNGTPVAPWNPRTGALMTEAEWRRYMAEFVEQIRAAFPGEEIVHNALWWPSRSDAFVQRQLLAADVICLERGVNDAGLVGGSGTFGFDSFLGLIDWLHARGRAVYFLPGVSTDGAREYGLAAYFLVNTGGDGIGNDPGTGDSPADWWPGYDVFLGTARGPRYAASGSVLRRDFDGGTVLVNPPGAAQTTVTLEATYRDLAGRDRTSVTLGPAQGAVLRRPTAPPAPPVLLDVVPVN